jgi:hypothetical protein
MKILELRILPPMAIGRLGSAASPMPAYDLKISDIRPLDFREVVPEKTFTVNEKGEITGEVIPDNIKFKEVESLEKKDGKVRPVAPFLEVFAITDAAKDLLVPLTTELLMKAGYTLKDISWDVAVGNIKIFRRTRKAGDKIFAALKNITNHAIHHLEGKSKNFLKGKTLPLGTIQFICPSKKYPEIRLRFTPGKGKIYGAGLYRYESAENPNVRDPVIESNDDVIYDEKKGWKGFQETGAEPIFTAPGDIFAGYIDAEEIQTSWGYVDDECDGFVSVHLRKKGGSVLTARAHISAGPPAFAPDTLPVRVVTDELEQILMGTDVAGAVSIDEAEEIIRRAFETIRLMNTAIMNGNPLEGRLRIASTMSAQDTNDFGRCFEPIMANSLVDNLALRTLHERIFNGLASGAAPWFEKTLRRFDEVGDLSDQGRRKMPAMMRGADGRALTFTRRQINTIIKAAASAMFKDRETNLVKKSSGTSPSIKANNLTAQLHYRGNGNPIAVLPSTAISNCFPGLEFDFRNLWRRAFREITLIENNNYVIDADKEFRHLKGCRLLVVDGNPTMVVTEGPVFPGEDSQVLINEGNPNGVSFLEWSNSLADVLQKQGKKVVCYFTANQSETEVLVNMDDLNNKDLYQKVRLTVNNFFEGKSAAFSEEIIKPGELTQGLCAPWQNDYRECACYYWAASRPDYVNVIPNDKGSSTGDMWMSRNRTGKYIPDNLSDSRLLSYDDLFTNWEGELNFIIRGNDAIETESNKDKTPKV